MTDDVDTGEGLGMPEPTSLAEIALLRLRRDETASFIETIEEQEPYLVRSRSYGEIARRAAALAHALSEAGVSPGDRVGCYLPNAPCWVVASLGTWWSGGVVAAVGTLLPAAEAERLFALAGVSTAVALEGADLSSSLHLITVDEEGLRDGGKGDLGPETVPDLRLPAPDEIAGVFFTSGTTGHPKGITRTHHDFVAAGRQIVSGYARNAAYRPDPAPAGLPPGVIFNAFGHMAGYARLAFRMWIGRPSLLVPKFNVNAVRALLSRFDIDTLPLTPTMLHMLATSDEELDLSGLKYVTSGTAPLSLATREQFETRFGVPVMQAYGMTELGAVAQERLDDVVAGRRGPGSVGRIAAGVEVDIRPLDDDRPQGEGEIFVRTAGAPDEFIGGQAAPIDDAGWFATGDVGRLDDGILYITGRVMEKIIVGGFNVYPAEVEEVLRRSALVRDAVVVGLPDERLGERPVAGIAWAAEPAEAQLAEEIRAQLAHYKVPRAYFPLDAVPLTPREKIDRRLALELARTALGVVTATDS